MKALVKRKAEPGLWLEEVPVPEVGDDDVLIRIKKTSICGTDVHIYNWDAWSQKTIPVPMVIGHEFVGVVERVGERVKGFAPGRSRHGRRPHRLRSLPQLSGRAASSLPEYPGRRRQSSGRVRGISFDPDVQCLARRSESSRSMCFPVSIR